MTSLIEPTCIDAEFVPRFRASVVTIDVGTEAVLYEEDTGALHQLDPIAAVVCACFDGRTPIRQMVAELSAAYEVDHATVETDVVGLARALGARGLFDGVRGEAPPEESHGAC